MSSILNQRISRFLVLTLCNACLFSKLAFCSSALCTRVVCCLCSINILHAWSSAASLRRFSHVNHLAWVLSGVALLSWNNIWSFSSSSNRRVDWMLRHYTLLGISRLLFDQPMLESLCSTLIKVVTLSYHTRVGMACSIKFRLWHLLMVCII